MKLNISFFLIGLPLTFALGWIASRLDIRQLWAENRRAPQTYFKGLTFLLNEQQDEAIDVFIEAVKEDPNASELHFALGDLFRRRGEYERAVRIHIHLLSRVDLSKSDLERAQYGLAQDYLKAGILDRAEAALTELKGTDFSSKSELALLTCYERSREWTKAAEIAKQLQLQGHHDLSSRLSHYLCEQAEKERINQRLDLSKKLLEEALTIAAKNGRPHLALSQLLEESGDYEAAWKISIQALQDAPRATPLIARQLLNPAIAAKKIPATLEKLYAIQAHTSSLDVIESIITLEEVSGKSESTPRDWYIRQLSRGTSLVAASKWLQQERFEHEQYHDTIQRTLDTIAKPLMKYRCAACGFEVSQYFWQCPGCQTWDSYPPLRIEEL